MEIHWTAASFLWLLLLAPVFAFVPRRSKDLRHVLLRCAVWALLVLGLARPVVFRDAGAEHHVYVVDRSASVGSDSLARVENALAEQPAIAGGARVARVDLGGAAEEAPPALSVGGRSPLGSALEAALGQIPIGAAGSVTLVSDGRATERDWAPVVQAFVERAVPVHACVLADDSADAFVAAVELEGRARVGQTARVWVDVVAREASAQLRLFGPGGPLAETAAFEVRGRRRIALEFEPENAGFTPARVELTLLSGTDANTGNNSRDVLIAVQDPLRVTYLGGRVTGSAGELERLLGPGFELANAAPLDDAVLSAEDLAPLVEASELVWIDDRPASTVTRSALSEIVDAVVQRGAGLVMSGGSAAFGPGGYQDTEIADVLPVEFLQKEEKRDPSTSLVLIIDTSGSMGGNRVQLAKEVARLAIRRLLPHDKVGIVEFYGSKRWAAPLQPASNAIEIERALNRLDAGGGTVILPAIEEAFYGLQNVQTRYKHVLVLTDGGVETGAFEPLLRRMSDKGITVSTVLIGPDAHSEFLVTLANWGKGRFYSVPNRFNLPEVLLKQPASAKLPAYRPGRHKVRTRGGEGWWGQVPRDGVPELAGFVESKSRPGAEVLVETERGEHPILATWHYGLGRVTALTTEPTGSGTEPWQDWQGYGPWLARVLSRTAADGLEPFEFELARLGFEVTLTARRRDGGAVVPVAEDVVDAAREVVFEERAPGVFRARWFASPNDEVRILAGAGPMRERLALPSAASAAPETSVDPELGLDLARLAEATGGNVISLAALTDFVPPTGPAAAPVGLRKLSPLLFVLALLTYLVELYYRRRPTRRSPV